MFKNKIRIKEILVTFSSEDTKGVLITHQERNEVLADGEE